jgi:hypothetical protein
LYSEKEVEAETEYNKKVMQTFETNLTSTTDAKKFAELLSKRYTKIKQTVRL